MTQRVCKYEDCPYTVYDGEECKDCILANADVLKELDELPDPVDSDEFQHKDELDAEWVTVWIVPRNKEDEKK